MKRMSRVLAAFLITVIVIIGGCAKSPPSPTPLTAAEIFAKSGDAMLTVNSFKFALDQIGGGTPITGGVEMTKASGDVVRPDKLQMTIDGTAFGTSIEVKVVTSGDKTLMTNPLSGKWEVPPDQFKVLSVFDPGTGIASIMKKVMSPTKLADEQMGGTLSYHLKGSITSDTLRPIMGTAAQGAIISAEVWIGKDDLLVRHIKLEGKITETEKDGIVRTLDLSNFNEQISITLPAQ
jgi:hypothetical protein